MDSRNERQQAVTRVSRELGSELRREAGERWSEVRVAHRNEGDHHVWRFRTGADGPERFLRVAHRAMTRGGDRSAAVLERLRAARWIERLHGGPETALLLTGEGEVRTWPIH
jgi:hypothetical protein